MFIVSSCKINQDLKQDLLRQFPEVHFCFCDDIEEAEKHLPEADILLTYGEDLEDQHIESAKRLQWIMVLSAGVDRMPFKKIKEKNILVTNSRGIHKIPMAEYVISMLLQIFRQSKLLMENEKAHKWDKSVTMEEITGKAMLVAGTGAIGGEVARLAKAFRMKTIGISRSGKPVDHFDQVFQSDQILDVLPTADFVISILPSTEETRHFFGKAHFQAMNRKAIFVNIGRGSTVCEQDLIEALQEKEIFHAVLDVFEQEPLPEHHPFWDMDNVTVTPHLSGVTPQYQPRAIEIFVQNLKSYLKGENLFINIVDPNRGY
ncbi:MAG: D-2-hydroxyacid dehydrogenase [Bacillaceae bacterium]|nr:D-2-hydroxyacid dehydrogenase [Bacillaceae bacterium]